MSVKKKKLPLVGVETAAVVEAIINEHKDIDTNIQSSVQTSMVENEAEKKEPEFSVNNGGTEIKQSVSISTDTDIKKCVHISTDNIIMMSGSARRKGGKVLMERRTERMNLLLPPSVAAWFRAVTGEQRYSLNDAAIEAFQMWGKAHNCAPYIPPEMQK